MNFHRNHAEIGTLRADFRRFVNGKPCYAHNAISSGDALSFSLNIPRRLGVSAIEAIFIYENQREAFRLTLNWQGFSDAEDEYTGILSEQTTHDLHGLYFYYFEAETAFGKLIGGRARENGDISFHFGMSDSVARFQLTVSDFVGEPPAWIYGSTIYHVFVDRFCRHGETCVRENAILNPDWENGIPQYPDYPGAPLKNNMFFGGNLAGIEEKLDYFVSLGVGCLYLSPIFEAYSNHKYDTGNYMKVDEMFGGDEAFQSLLLAASKKGIRIVLDGVFNHTGDDSVYFNRYGHYDSVGAYQSEASPYYSWYRFTDFPDKYICWWNIPILPRIHPEDASCREFFVGKDGVIAHYARMGIGGFRLDVADELGDSFIAEIRSAMRAHQHDAILYGEVWEDASNKIAYGVRKQYYCGKELDGVMNYPVRVGLIDFLRNHDASALRYALTEVLPNAPKRIADAQMNLLGTHDTERILTALAGRLRGNRSNEELAHARMNEDEYQKGVALLRLAYTALATLPGVPTIFYGDEVGMQGYQDPFNRLPFPWHCMDDSILSYYRQLGRLRQEMPIYKEGEFALLCLDEYRLVFVRFDESICVLTALNTAKEEYALPIDEDTRIFVSQNCHTSKGHMILDSDGAAVFTLSHASLGRLDGKNGITLPSFLRRDRMFQLKETV